MNITKGKIPSPLKVVLYGVEGIGKSTFASQFPAPLFIDTEGSTKNLDIARFDKPTSWQMLLQEVRYVVQNPNCCKTLVIDTADWAEQLEIADLCARKNGQGLKIRDMDAVINTAQMNLANCSTFFQKSQKEASML